MEKELKLKNLSIDKPLAFLLNPPYKNTDEHESAREDTKANYTIHASILELTGDDAGKERYLAFLGQILNISKLKAQESEHSESLVLIFTPTSWLIPRPSYVAFRKEWDKHFSYQDGFIITSNEFFKLQGKWPLAFTIWKYNYNETRTNKVEVADYSNFKHQDLNINWNLGDEELNFVFGDKFLNQKKIRLDNSLESIKKWASQSMYDFKRDPTQRELGSNLIYGGLPLIDNRRQNKKTYGISMGEFLGFMDDASPVRVKQDNSHRLSNSPDRVWFRFDTGFLDINKSKCFSGPTDQKSYCAYDLLSAQKTFTWFGISKTLNGLYPLWANQSDIWAPTISSDLASHWYALCFSFVLAENRCVVTTFEKDNPVPGASEIFIDNPLCPANKESFWATTLNQEITADHGIAYELVNKIKLLYKTWNLNYCKGQYLRNVGLKDEPYFKYFDYEDYLTPYSGLIQLKKYAINEGLKDIHDQFTEIQELTKKVKEELYRLLVEEFRYFE